MPLGSIFTNMCRRCFVKGKLMTLNEIAEMYEDYKLEYDDFTITDDKYIREKKILENILDDDQQIILAFIEDLWVSNAKWVVDFSFHQGIISYYSDSSDKNVEIIGKLFTKYVYKKCLSMPGIKNYPLYYLESNARLKMFDVLNRQLSNEDRIHLYAVGCSWDKKVYSSAYDAFNIGLLTARKGSR